MNADAGRKLAESPLLTLTARFLTILISIFAFPTVVWVGSNIISLNQENGMSKLRLDNIERDLAELRRQRALDLQSLATANSSLTARLGQIETSIAVQIQQAKETDRRVSDLSNYLQNRLGLSPPK